MCTHRERYVRGFLMSLFPILLYGNKNKLSPCDAGRPHWKQEQDVIFPYHYLEVLCCLRKVIETKCKRWAVWSKLHRLCVRAEWEQLRRQPGHHKSSEPSFLWAGGSQSSDTPSIGAGKGRSTGRDDSALHLADYLDGHGTISMWSTWKICVFSPCIGTGNWSPTVKYKVREPWKFLNTIYSTMFVWLIEALCPECSEVFQVKHRAAGGFRTGAMSPDTIV